LPLLVPPALLAIVVAVGVLGRQSEVAPAPAARAVAAPSAVAVAAPVAAPVDPLAAAHAVDGDLGQAVIPYEWRPKLADRVDRFTIDDSVLLAEPDRVDRFTIDDSIFAAATPRRRSDWPRAIASPYPG
jgi:hypothetical protein